MMRRAALLVLLCAAAAAQAQMYKWKDDKGVTHYTDTPPPASAKKAEVKSFNTGGNPDLPPELADAVRARPVVLYTTANCAGCEQGRALLNNRGIPFRERTVTSADDQAALKAAGSDGQLPLLTVGRTKQVGFESSAWDELLSNAGYPTIKALPQGYQNPPPVAAAPPKGPSAEQVAQDSARAAAAEEARRKAQQQSNAPPGFQF
ncbi:glutaredoxin family protein [Pseudoduganella sp. RAF53_2]|uniref:glutaredoxin family protein n=1 Tax=unclassified Pseudoduganella TaxID=2637179 RepID=UPI003F9D3042